MNKRTRFIIVLVVLAVCFWFLWPSISWYARTPKDQQSLALGSLEKIKDYTTDKAKGEVDEIIALAEKSPDEHLDPSYDYLVKAAKKNYKELAKAYDGLIICHSYSLRMSAVSADVLVRRRLVRSVRITALCLKNTIELVYEFLEAPEAASCKIYFFHFFFPFFSTSSL